MSLEWHCLNQVQLTSIMQVDNGTLKIINLDRWRTDGEKTDHTVYGCINQLVTASCSWLFGFSTILIFPNYRTKSSQIFTFVLRWVEATNLLSIPNSLNTGTIVFIEALRVSLLQMSLIRQTTKQTEEPSTDSVFGKERQTTKLFMFLNCWHTENCFLQIKKQVIVFFYRL